MHLFKNKKIKRSEKKHPLRLGGLNLTLDTAAENRYPMFHYVAMVPLFYALYF